MKNAAAPLSYAHTPGVSLEARTQPARRAHSDLSSRNRIYPTLPNSGKPEFGRGEVDRDCVNVSGTCARLPKIFGLELDGSAVGRALRRMIPGIAITRERLRVGHALGGDDAFERVEPMPVIGLARVGIARRLGTLDLRGEDCRPFRPGEEAAIVKRESHGEGLRLPWLAKHRALGIVRNAGDLLGGHPRSFVIPAERAERARDGTHNHSSLN